MDFKIAADFSFFTGQSTLHSSVLSKVPSLKVYSIESVFLNILRKWPM